MEIILKKRSIFAVVITLLVLGLPSLNSVNAETIGGPRIELNKSSHDFGEVLQGAKPKHTFMFKNTGDRKLVIEKIKAG